MQLPQTRADRHGLPDHAGRHAVAVALEGDHRRPRDDALHVQHRRKRHPGQRQQRLLAGKLGDRSVRALAPVRDRDRPSVRISLGVTETRDRRGASPRAGDVLHSRLNDALALRPPGRADPDLHAIVLSELRELAGDAIRAGTHDRGHPVRPPRPRRPAQAAQHPVDCLRQMREALALADHRTRLP